MVLHFFRYLTVIFWIVLSRTVFALDVQINDREINEVLPWLANEAGESLVMSPDISGRLSLVLYDTSWREFLQIVSEKQGLELTWQGKTALLAKTTVATQSTSASVQSDSCVTHFVSLEHAKAEKVGGHLKTLFPKMSVSIDERTNSLIAINCQSKEELMRVVRWLDSPLRQIEISARIAQVRGNAQSQFGVNWETQTANTLIESGFGGAIDLGALEASGAFTFALTKGEKILALTLDLLESEGRANIISEPKIVTAEGHAARIESGTEVPYQTHEDDAVSVEFKQVGLMLEVTPFVKDGDKIQLNLTIHQDAVGDLVNGIPSLETNRIKTQVVVVDQETLVLGGIFRDENLISESKVPLLGDLPLLGGLFKRRIERQEKVELLVFITPKLLQMTTN
ncbi:type II and III secretion system protein [Marinomonas algicola]|uniref:type II and III secretion system protein n=1 Tax=Marinomonas algicola TaxID=2773454 RepID=UPI00174B7535|nr:type II and III secretion system protein [Marinomonas algicola]